MPSTKPGVQERILLHLLDYSDYKNSVEVPFSLSQMGIANAVAIARSNVPRAIAGLKDQGLLIERQAHVKGVSRKRKAYFLTESGKTLAEDTWNDLRSFALRCILADGKIQSTTLGEINTILPFSMRSVDIIRYMDDNCIIDSRTLSADLIERDLSKHVEKQLVTSLGDLPRLRHFYGRENELDNMFNLLEARATTLLVPGIAGIGKTTMASKLIERFMHRRNLLYHRCQDWEGARAFLEAVSEWLSAMGSDDLSDYLASTPVPQPQMAVNLISEGLESSPSLIVIDDLHKVGDETLISVLRSLSLKIPELDNVGLVMFSRSFRMVVPESDSSGRIVTLVMPLDGLDQEASRKILTTMQDIEMPQFLHIHSLSRGHPLVLELINRGSVGGTFHETLEAFVEKEIFSRLSGAEKRLLGAIAVFREPMPLEALSAIDMETDLLDDLVEKGLARQADSENYDVHDLVREFLTRSMEDSLKQSLHANAVEWYRTRKDDPSESIEHIHHLHESGDIEGLASALSEEGHKLVKAGHIELLGILRVLEARLFGPRTRFVIHELTGDILSVQGKWDEAEGQYDMALPIAVKHKLTTPLARIYSSRADLAVKKGEMDTALSLHKKALEMQIKLRDAQGAARSYNNMGYIFRRQRDNKRALEVYGNVEELLNSEESSDLTEARIRLASAFLEMGEMDRARDHAMKAHDETAQNNQEKLHARSRAVLGRYYARIKDNDLAMHHYSGALEILSDQSDPRSAVEVEMLLGQVLSDAGRSDEAAQHYLDALSIAEANDFRMMQGEILSRLGEVESNRSQRMDYLQRSLVVFRELGAVDRMRDVQNSVHRVVMGH